MLKGSKVGLRARHEDDIPILRAELYDDPVYSSRAGNRPWRPVAPGTKDPRLVVDDTDVVAVLCHYGFVLRGLHRLQIETLADNVAMLRAAGRNGFVREGVLRSSAWVMGEFLDQVLLGLLAEEWKPAS
ncbi:GNAT family protein [Nonomuraea sp. NPDC001023]|uniref:GNAT family N-acetyltransferase n=1 Tax=unclassified Nonomuraea TaxID=2593643 RepID=UPI00332E1C02